MDCAASEFYDEKTKKYDLDFKTANNDGKLKVSNEELSNIYGGYCSKYPIVSIEDPFD